LFVNGYGTRSCRAARQGRKRPGILIPTWRKHDLLLLARQPPASASVCQIRREHPRIRLGPKPSMILATRSKSLLLSIERRTSSHSSEDCPTEIRTHSRASWHSTLPRFGHRARNSCAIRDRSHSAFLRTWSRPCGRIESRATPISALKLSPTHYDAGQRLDVDRYRGFAAIAAHQEVEFVFAKDPTIPTVSVVIPCYNKRRSCLTLCAASPSRRWRTGGGRGRRRVSRRHGRGGGEACRGGGASSSGLATGQSWPC